jgi:signal transduction histidine kinase
LNPAVFIVLPNAGAFDERDAREVRTLLASRVGARRIVLVLDRAYLQGSLVPTLAALHFAEDDSIRYELTVVDPLDPENPIYRRGVARAARQSWQTADVRVPLFSPPLDVAAAWMMTGYFSEGANDIVELKSNLIVGAGPTGEGWQLLVTHSAGSLDAAVTQMRRRNLWLSFGILAVLAAGVGLVAANARRSQQIAQQQMDFVVTISHELRTPLAVIRSAAENLTTKLATDTVEVAQYGKLIEAEGRRLSDMVEQVLAFAGLTGTRPQTTRLIDVGAMARAVVAARDELITGGHVEISLVVDEPLPRISGDERAIRRAVEELVINAGKHGGEGGWIGIAVRRVSIRGREEVHLSVSDRGRGIDAADLPHIFEPFYRGRRAWDRQVQGSGFGLSLVARTADAHGGRVAATSTGGETTVTLCLPIARNAGDSQAAAPEA